MRLVKSTTLIDAQTLVTYVLSGVDNNHTTTGIFFCITATDRTIRYKDITTREIKSAQHAIFDETH